MRSRDAVTILSATTFVENNVFSLSHIHTYTQRERKREKRRLHPRFSSIHEIARNVHEAVLSFK